MKISAGISRALCSCRHLFQQMLCLSHFWATTPDPNAVDIKKRWSSLSKF